MAQQHSQQEHLTLTKSVTNHTQQLMKLFTIPHVHETGSNKPNQITAENDKSPSPHYMPLTYNNVCKIYIFYLKLPVKYFWYGLLGIFEANHIHPYSKQDLPLTQHDQMLLQFSELQEDSNSMGQIWQPIQGVELAAHQKIKYRHDECHMNEKFQNRVPIVQIVYNLKLFKTQIIDVLNDQPIKVEIFEISS